MVAEDFIADSLNQVGFAETDTTIDVEGVIHGAGVGDDSFTGGKDEVVVVADDEVIEEVFRVEVGDVLLEATRLGGESGGKVGGANGGIFAAAFDFLLVADTGDGVFDKFVVEAGGLESGANRGGIFTGELADDKGVRGAEDEAAVVATDKFKTTKESLESYFVDAATFCQSIPSGLPFILHICIS